MQPGAPRVLLLLPSRAPIPRGATWGTSHIGDLSLPADSVPLLQLRTQQSACGGRGPALMPAGPALAGGPGNPSPSLETAGGGGLCTGREASAGAGACPHLPLRGARWPGWGRWRPPPGPVCGCPENRLWKNQQKPLGQSRCGLGVRAAHPEPDQEPLARDKRAMSLPACPLELVTASSDP